MNIQFLPRRSLQVSPTFFQYYLPGYAGRRDGVCFQKEDMARTGRGFRKAARMVQEHLEELHYYGTSNSFSRGLEKSWSKDCDYFLIGTTWRRSAPFASIFADLARCLAPDGKASKYFFRIMSNFLIRNFNDMMKISPQTAMICFNALDWMGHDMADICAVVGQEVSLFQELDDFDVPFPFRPHTLELLDEVSGRPVPYRRRMDPWYPLSDWSGQAVYTTRRPRLTPDGPRHNRILQLPWYSSVDSNYIPRPWHRFLSFDRRNLLPGPGIRFPKTHMSLPLLRHPHGNAYRMRLLT